MEDMTDILDVRGSPSPPAVEAKQPAPSGSKKKKAQKGISREVLSLMSLEAQAAASEKDVVPVPITGRRFTIDPSFKTRAWQWEGYHNSARSDGARLKHWMRKPMVVDDYPFTRFNKASYVVSFADHQYQEVLDDPSWTRAETDALVALCRRFDCRWPVIHDRWPVSLSERSVVDLRERYFAIAKSLVTKYTEEQMTGGQAVDPRVAKLTADARAAIKAFTFDGEDEREKMTLMDLQFRRNKTSDSEIAALQGEVQKHDAEIKKLRADRKKLEEQQRLETKKKRKKAVEVIAAAQTAAGIGPASSSSTGAQRSKDVIIVSAKATPPSKKPKIELPELAVADLPQVLSSITGSLANVDGTVFKRSHLCRPLHAGGDSAPAPNAIQLEPPLGPTQAKSLALLLAKREGEGQPLPTANISNVLVPYYQDAVRLIVYEHALKKKKGDLRNLKLKMKKARQLSDAASPAAAPRSKKKVAVAKPTSHSSVASAAPVPPAVSECPVPTPVIPPLPVQVDATSELSSALEVAVSIPEHAADVMEVEFSQQTVPTQAAASLPLPLASHAGAYSEEMEVMTLSQEGEFSAPEGRFGEVLVQAAGESTVAPQTGAKNHGTNSS